MIKYPSFKQMKITAIVLAGGKGTRMKSPVPKVLMKIAGKPIIYWTASLLSSLKPDQTIVVVGYKNNLVKNTLKGYGFANIKYVLQKTFLGTAHAVKICLKHLNKDCKTVLVLFGDDSGLYSGETLLKFIEFHTKLNSKMTVLVTEMSHPTDIGGLEIDKDKQVKGVLTLSELVNKRIKKPTVLCGAFCFEKKWLLKNLPLVPKSKSSGEYPLPGLFSVTTENKNKAKCFYLKDQNEWNSINTQEELATANKKKGRLLSGI